MSESKRPVFGAKPPTTPKRRKAREEELARQAHEAVAFSLRLDGADELQGEAQSVLQPHANSAAAPEQVEAAKELATAPPPEATPAAAPELAGAAEESATAMLGEERTVRLAEIQPPDAVHAVVHPKFLHSLKDTILTGGARGLIILRELTAGRCGGEHRYEIVTGAADFVAHQTLGSEELRVRVVTCSEVEVAQSRIAEDIHEPRPNAWRRIVNVVHLRTSMAAEGGCAVGDVLQKEVARKAPGLNEGLVSLCCSAHRAMVEAGVDLDDEKLHNISRGDFRLISRAEGDPARVRHLVVTATSRKALRGKALAQEMEERLGEFVTVEETEEGPRVLVRDGVPPEDVSALIRYAGGKLRKVLADRARRPQRRDATDAQRAGEQGHHP